MGVKNGSQLTIISFYARLYALLPAASASSATTCPHIQNQTLRHGNAQANCAPACELHQTVFVVWTGDITDHFLTVIRRYKRQNNHVRTERGQNYCGNQSLSHLMPGILL